MFGKSVKLNTVSKNAPPPQTYSRLFRPWDLAKRAESENQDSTISTTTDSDSDSDISVVSQLNCDSDSKHFTLEQQSTKIHPSHIIKTPAKNCRSEHHLKKRPTPSAQPIHHHNNHKSAFSPILNAQEMHYPDLSHYPDILFPQFPFLPPNDLVNPGLLTGNPATDSLILTYAMEQEYARVLQEEQQAKIMSSRKQRPKKFKCPHCNVGFSNNGQLKGHVRIHTGERPFHCEESGCGKTFTRNEELTRHKRIHTGLRPYVCAACGKRFGRRDHLKKHAKTHMVHAERYLPVLIPAMGPAYPYLYGY